MHELRPIPLIALGQSKHNVETFLMFSHIKSFYMYEVHCIYDKHLTLKKCCDL